MTRHVIRVEIEARFRRECAYPKLDIEYSYTCGRRATGPSYASGGEPGWGAEIEMIRATLVDGDGLNPPQKIIDQWAEDWLDDDGYDKACLVAEDESGPDPDEAYERMRDDRDWGFE